jgi:hypothetical protein
MYLIVNEQDFVLHLKKSGLLLEFIVVEYLCCAAKKYVNRIVEKRDIYL